MQRRDLIKTLAALPMIFRPVGGIQAASVKIETGKHVMFVDDEAIDLEALAYGGREMADDPFEGVLFVGVRLRPNQKIDDVLRIYKLEG